MRTKPLISKTTTTWAQSIWVLNSQMINKMAKKIAFRILMDKALIIGIQDSDG